MGTKLPDVEDVLFLSSDSGDRFSTSIESERESVVAVCWLAKVVETGLFIDVLCVSVSNTEVLVKEGGVSSDVILPPCWLEEAEEHAVSARTIDDAQRASNFLINRVPPISCNGMKYRTEYRFCQVNCC